MADLISRQRLPSTVAFETGQQIRGELLGAAASRVPDQTELTQQLLDYDLPVPDFNKASTVISSEVADFISRYRKNPYYSFSRAGRNQLQRIQGVINSPALQNAEKLYASAKETFDKNQKVSNELVVNGNRIAVYTVGEDGNAIREWINIDEFDPDRMAPATMNTDKQFIETRFGIGEFVQQAGGLPEYNLADIEDIKSSFRTAFNDLGKTRVAGQQLGGVLDREYISESNAAQIQNRIAGVVNTLTDAERNTLKGQYIKRVGGQATNQGFEDWLVNEVGQYSRGEESFFTSEKFRKSAQLDAAQAQSELNTTITLGDKISQGFYGTGTVTTSATDDSEATGREQQQYIVSSPSREVPVEVIVEETGRINFTNPEGIETKSHLVKDIGMLDQAGDLNRIAIQIGEQTSDGRYQAGDYKFITNPGLKRVLALSDDAKGHVIERIIDPSTGEPVPHRVEAAIREYIKTKGRSQLDPAIIKRYQIPGGGQLTEEGLTAQFATDQFFYGQGIVGREVGGGRNDPSIDELKELGLESSENRQLIKWYQNNVPLGSEIGTPGALFSIDDEVYTFSFMIPIDESLLGISTGTKTFTTKEVQSVGNFGDRNQIIEVPVNRGTSLGNFPRF